jgi:hypothetical protein
MDSFTAISSVFTSSNIDDITSIPSDEEWGGSGGNSYCVVAWVYDSRAHHTQPCLHASWLNYINLWVDLVLSPSRMNSTYLVAKLASTTSYHIFLILIYFVQNLGRRTGIQIGFFVLSLISNSRELDLRLFLFSIFCIVCTTSRHIVSYPWLRSFEGRQIWARCWECQSTYYRAGFEALLRYRLNCPVNWIL